MRNEAKEVIKTQKRIQSPELQRKLSKIAKTGISVLEQEDQRSFQKLVKNMTEFNRSVKIPDFTNKRKSISCEPEVIDKMATSRDPNELEFLWTKFRDTAGE